MFSKNDTETNQVSNYLDNILNSTSPITPKILFDALDNCEINEQDKLKLLFDKAFKQGINIDIKEETGRATLLHCAFIADLLDIARFLLEKGADPNITLYRNTCLHYITSKIAYIKYDIEMIELLIQKSNLELKNIFNYTVIQAAVIFYEITDNSKEVIKLLIQHGADIEVKVFNKQSEYNGKNVIEIATKKPILKSLLTLTKACKDNDFSIVDNTITTKDIAEFVDWRMSITPDNSRFFLGHLKMLHNLRKYLAAKELIDAEKMQSLNKTINSYSTLYNSLIFKIVDTPKLYKKICDENFIPHSTIPNYLIDQFKICGLK